MKKIITPLGALVSLLFVPMTWIYLNQMTLSYAGKKMPVSFYEMFKAAPALGFVRFGLIFIALILLIVPFFLKNPLRKNFVVSLSVVAFILLAAFLNFKDELTRGGGFTELGIGWFGAFFGFVIAFAGAFIRAAKDDAPEKSSLPALAWIVVLICLPVSFFGYLFTFPPFGSFPSSADGIPRTSRVEYRKDENYPGVYVASYGSNILHTMEKKNSAEEAKEAVKKVRESIVKESERARESWKNKNVSEGDMDAEAEKYYRKDRDAVFLADEDNPENDYVVYVSNGRSGVAWVSGNRFYTVNAPKADAQYSDLSPAAETFNFARSMSNPPTNTTAPQTKTNDRPSSLYEFYYDRLPRLLSEWSLVAAPLIIAAPFLVLLILGIFRRKEN